MRLLSWNIQQGGGTRDVKIVSAIAAHNPDVIALTEYRARPGMALCQAFAANGWPHIATSNPQGNDNGICVLSRVPLEARQPVGVPEENAVRWLDVHLPEQGFSLSVVHILTALPGQKDPEAVAKKRLWEALLVAAGQRAGEPVLLIGDLNTGLPLVDEEGSTFVCWEEFAQLPKLGWTDLWRHFHGDAREYTWFSLPKRGMPGSGFRLDHAFATGSLLPRMAECRYSHGEREAKVSDHSPLIVEVR